MLTYHKRQVFLFTQKGSDNSFILHVFISLKNKVTLIIYQMVRSDIIFL